MSLTHLVLFAIFAFLSSNHETEAKGVKPELNINTLLNNPASKTNFIDLILKGRGTSVEQIHERVAGADGNLELVISELNSEIKGDLARIDGDSIRLNPEEVRTLLKDGLQQIIQSQFGNNPLAAAVLQENINKRFFEAPNADFNFYIENKVIPLESAQKFLETNHINRNRRSLQPRDFDLTSVITDIVLSLVQDQLGGVIWNLLENVKNVLIDLRTNTRPNDTFANVISYAINSLIDGGISIIVQIQETIRPTVTSTASSVSRRKRQAEDGTGVTTPSSGDSDAGSSGGGAGGGLSLILQPILDVLLVLLTPVRLLLQVVLYGLVGLLSPLLGGALTDTLNGIVDSIINGLLPF